MNGYLLSVIGTILLAAILTAIVPEGKTANTVKGVTKLVCLLVIISPILTFLQKEGDKKTVPTKQTFFSESVIETDKSFIQYYSEMRIEQSERDLATELETKFHLPCSVEIEWEYADKNSEIEEINGLALEILQIKIEVQSEYKEEDKSRMWEYVTKNYCSEVLIE